MVILKEAYGQTSNNYFQHIHLDSFCKENGINFYNPFLRKKYTEYPGLRGHFTHEIINSLILFFKLTHSLNLIKTRHFYIDDPDNKTTILNSKLLFCGGWLFRSFDTTIKFRAYYQNLFNPNINKQYLNQIYLQRENTDEKIIAVHLRRGDYKNYSNGIYYFSDGVYINYIQQLVKCLKTDHYRIILFSNDQSLNNEEYKQKLINVFFSNESETAEHFLMSKCDYIIGPPSTFSLWASYIGETPFYHFKNADDKISLDKFSVCNG